MKNTAPRFVTTLLLTVLLTGAVTGAACAAASPYADFSYSKIDPSWGVVTKEEFNALMKDVKHPTSYSTQFSAIMQYLGWISPPSPSLEALIHEVTTRQIVIHEEEIARLKAYIDKVKPSNQNAKKIARVCWDIHYLYQEIYDFEFPYLVIERNLSSALTPDANADTEETLTLETIDPEHLTQKSLYWINKEIEGIRSILSYYQDYYKDWDTAKSTVTRMITLLEIRHNYFRSYFQHEGFVFPEHVDYPIPTWKLGS
ncbi:MAG: hypothetical protein VB104_12260 [Candidatus Limiplasma sp.]|nr:hypothetical protein [Candidatus Limiplasma sp.]